MTDDPRRSVRALATVCVLVLGGSLLAAAPTAAEPDIETVQTRVDRLYHRAEQASERYNDARLRLKRAQHRLSALASDLERQQAKVDTVRDQVATGVVAQYQGQALSSTSQVLLSEDPDAFIDRLTTISAFNDQQTQMMAHFAVQARRLEARKAASSREVARIASTKEQLRAEKAEVDASAAEAKTLLSELKERAAARASRAEARSSRAEAESSASADQSSAASVAPAAPASGRAAAAVRYAMAQIGNAYVYGAAGPSAFDCSGLTMTAWAQAGVSLPHSSRAQMGSGTPVSQSQLQPGDLVFYYSPVSHVGMYVGNGQIVNALNPSSGIRISGVNSMPYSGAVRPG